MKIILPAVLIFSFVLAAAGPVKSAECPMARKKSCALCPEKMSGVETAAKNTAKGVEITMTAKNKDTVAKVQELGELHYNNKQTMDPGCPARVEGAVTTFVKTETGVRVEITGTTPEMIKKIQAASLKEHGMPKASVEAKKNAKAEVKKSPRYVCPMGCASSDKPGKCPKCGMEMTEKK